MSTLDQRSLAGSSPQLPGARINLWTLKFEDEQINRDYVVHRMAESGRAIAIAALTGTLVFLLIGIHDAALSELDTKYRALRYMPLPVFALAVFLLFYNSRRGQPPRYLKLMEWSTLFALVMAGLITLFLVTLVSYPNKLVYLFYVALILVYIHGPTGLTFARSSLVGTFICLSTVGVFLATGDYDLNVEIEASLLLLVVINVMVMYFGHQFEIQARRHFRKIKAQEKYSEILQNVNTTLTESELRFRSLIESSPAAIFLKSFDGEYRMANSKIMSWYGLAEKDLVGKTSYDIFSKELADVFAAMDRDAVENGALAERELQLPFADGKLHTVTVTKFPVRGHDGRTIGIGTINTDVTARAEAEEKLRQAQKMEAIGKLTGGIAHDFNNLLAVIMGNAELILSRSPGSDARAKVIVRAAKRGAELTRRLLAYARQQPLRPRTTDVRTLVAGVSDMLGRVLGETIRIEVRTAANLWNVLADPGQIEDAILNLAINARDAMPSGGKLTIECANAPLYGDRLAEFPEAVAGDYVALAVIDMGSGMTREVQARAFEPFFTTKAVGQGSGLGLSMVYGFAKQSGGHVTIDSDVGKGTTVRIYLPRERAKAESRQLPTLDQPPLSQGGETVLVIEDDEEARKLVVDMLEGWNYRVVAVPDADAADRALNVEPAVDLVLSDIVLPGSRSGLEFAAQLRTTRPALRFVFMSGYSADAAKDDTLLANGQVRLDKPFTSLELAKAVGDTLRSGRVAKPGDFAAEAAAEHAG